MSNPWTVGFSTSPELKGRVSDDSAFFVWRVKINLGDLWRGKSKPPAGTAADERIYSFS
jgi:hypothetical protein